MTENISGGWDAEDVDHRRSDGRRRWWGDDWSDVSEVYQSYGAPRRAVGVVDEPTAAVPATLAGDDLDTGHLGRGDEDAPDVWLDLDDDQSNGSGGNGLRYLKGLAAVGVAGWLIAMVATLLSPSNGLDTTDGESDIDEQAVVPDDEEFGIGGGIAGPVVGQANPAQVLRVEGSDDGAVVAPDESSATDESTATAAPGGEGEPSTAAEPDAAGSDQASTDDGAATGSATTAPAGPSGTQPSTAGSGGGAGSATVGTGDYRSNLDLIRSVAVRNTNHDASPHRNTPSAQLVPQELYGPRSEYLGNPGGSPEQAFPVPQGGQFRTACEFSHFAYDDPLVFPGQPGAAHLHLFFGNTDVNAHSTYETLIDSGSSTCNGAELNRSGYWVPALFDDRGNVRVPDRIVVYYKGEGRARGGSEVYPAGAAMIALDDYNPMPIADGGVGGQKLSFQCSDNFSTNTGQGGSTMAACDGSMFASPGRWTVLEVNIKFPTCWNGQDPSNWENFRPSSAGGWYSNICSGEFNRTLPNLEYFVNYRVDPGENTANWFLSSDVDPTSFGATKATGGSTNHGDWWGGWHQETNQMWIDNCVNRGGGAASGCGFGYLTDGGPNGSAPYDGPALKMRPQYQGPHKVSASELMAQLCPNPRRSYAKPEDAAYCQPG